MTAEAGARPLIWVLKGLRQGDTAQAMALALEIGGRVEGKQLAFNAASQVPNFLIGARVSHLLPTARALLRPPWPDLVIATGRRTAPVSVWIKNQSQGRTAIVQLGRPRMALSKFDLVVATPQYGLPPHSNVVEIPVPFAKAKSVPSTTLAYFAGLWRDLPRPHVLAVVGGQKFPQRLSAEDLRRFGAALNRHAGKGGVILLDSPRSPPGALGFVRQQLTAPVWEFKRGDGDNPYQPALSLCDEMVVTSDSVSMVSEMLSTGKPTWIFRLPMSRWVPRWSAAAGVGASLAAKGLLHPPRDVDGFMQNLANKGFVGDIASDTAPSQRFGKAVLHGGVVQQIRSLLWSHQSGAPASGDATVSR